MWMEAKANSEAVIVLDLETTGLSPDRHAITEIAAVKMVNGELVDSFQTLINPQRKIPRFITRLTGINDEMVKDAPLIQDVLPELDKFIRGYIMVGHNISFDYRFLSANYEKHLGTLMKNELMCTAKLARRMLPDLPSKRLGSVCEHYGYINENAHRAMGDVNATTHVFNKMKEKLDEVGIGSFEEMLWFQSLGCARAQRELEKRSQ